MKTTFMGPVSKRFKNIATNKIDTFPERVKLTLNDDGVSYEIGVKMIEMYPRLKNIVPRGALDGRTWNSVSGKYNLDSKIISISEFHWLISQKIYIRDSENCIKATISHETGHGFDFSKVGSYSSTLGFKTIYEEDFNHISGKDKAGNYLKPFIQKGEAGRQETFAAIFGEIMDEDEFLGENYFTNCKLYIKNLLS